jgi:hypothetical protein
VIVYVLVTDALEIPTESKTLHFSEEGRVIGKHIFKWAVLCACLAHQYAPGFLYYLGFNHSGPVPELSDTGLASDDRIGRLNVAPRTQ